MGYGAKLGSGDSAEYKSRAVLSVQQLLLRVIH